MPLRDFDMRRPSHHVFAILFSIVLAGCGSSSDEPSVVSPVADGATAAAEASTVGAGGSGTDAGADITSGPVSDAKAALDGPSPADAVLVDEGPAIAPGHVHVDIDGVPRDFAMVADDWSADPNIVSISASPAGGTRPYPIVITLPKASVTGTVRCGETNIVLLSYADKSLGAEWSAAVPCEINLTQAAQKMGERWVGTFSGDLEIEVPSDAASPTAKLTNGVFDVPRLAR